MNSESGNEPEKKIIRQAIPHYGRDLMATLDHAYFDDAIVFCAPESWELARRYFPKSPRYVTVPREMERKILEGQIAEMPLGQTVFGIGGGSACDAAKMYAWTKKTRLILAPTILSVDAPFTKAIGVREDHRVRYVGEVFPDYLLVDFNLIEKAPPKLNRAGIGDILSIFTALWDWRLARDAVAETYDEAIAAESQALLDRLFAGAGAIERCDEEGLRLISELYVAEVGLCERMGNSRPEEGSEHYFAYALEHLTQKTFIHGELIALGILLASLHQEQDLKAVRRFLDMAMVEFRPKQVGATEQEIEQALLGLPAYLLEEKQLPYGVFHHKGISAEQAADLVKQLRGLC